MYRKLIKLLFIAVCLVSKLLAAENSEFWFNASYDQADKNKVIRISGRLPANLDAPKDSDLFVVNNVPIPNPKHFNYDTSVGLYLQKVRREKIIINNEWHLTIFPIFDMEKSCTSEIVVGKPYYSGVTIEFSSRGEVLFANNKVIYKNKLPKLKLFYQKTKKTEFIKVKIDQSKGLKLVKR